MTPDTSKARKLIEEARDIVMHTRGWHEADDAQLLSVFQRLVRALTLLPEWQEFDPKRDETWPKEVGDYLTFESVQPYGQDSISIEEWRGKPDDLWKYFSAFMPLPPPYEKK